MQNEIQECWLRWFESIRLGDVAGAVRALEHVRALQGVK